MIYDKNGFRLNGVDLADYGVFLTSAPVVDAVEAFTSYTEVPSLNGSMDLTLTDPSGAAYLKRRNVSLPLCAVGTIDDVTVVKRTLGALVGSVVEVYDPYERGRWKGRMSLSSWADRYEPDKVGKVSDVTLTVDAYPFLLMDERTVDVDMTKTYISYSVRPVWPTLHLEVSGATSCAADVYNSDGVSTGHLEWAFSSAYTGKLTVDCERGMAVKTDGAQAVPKLASDYPYVPVGTFTVKLVNCTGTMSYTPVVAI